MTIECIGAHLLQLNISVELNFVTFVVAYTPAEDAAEREKAIHGPEYTRSNGADGENVFVLTNANARTAKRGERGGETDSKESSTQTANHG